MSTMRSFDLNTLSKPNVYKLLASTVTPRPIAWIMTVDVEGNANAAPFSFFSSLPVNAVDTTAAGDVFNAAFAVALLEGHPAQHAARFANAAAAVSVTRTGAQTSIPTRGKVDALLR